MKILTALVLLLPALALAENTEDLGKIYSPKIVGNVLVVKGKIDSHIYDFLSYEAQKMKAVDVIELNSFGGNALWALEIAAKIKSLGKKTRLAAGNVCASACVYLFSAGSERIAAPGTWLGIHGARLGAGYITSFRGLCYMDLEDGPVFQPKMKGCQAFVDEWYKAAMDVTQKAFAFMESNGVSPTLEDTYFAMADDPNWPDALNVIRKPDWVLKAEDASGFGLVTKLQ